MMNLAIHPKCVCVCTHLYCLYGQSGSLVRMKCDVATGDPSGRMIPNTDMT